MGILTMVKKAAVGATKIAGAAALGSLKGGPISGASAGLAAGLKMLPKSSAPSKAPAGLPPLNLQGGAPQYASSGSVVTTTTTTTTSGAPKNGRKRLEDLNTRDLQAMDAAGDRIPFAKLKTYYKAPSKGYVILRDSGGGVHCLRKSIARDYGWRPGHKPMLSVGETQAIKKAGRAIDKFYKGEKEAAKYMRFKQHVLGHRHRPAIGYDTVVRPSGEIVIPKKGR